MPDSRFLLASDSQTAHPENIPVSDMMNVYRLRRTFDQ
jgi:hypothetical protein